MLRALALAIGVLSSGWASIGSAAPCAGFTDVDTSSGHCTEVTWIKNRGITFGCGAGLYCPNDPVTRIQMALFMYRQGNSSVQLGGNATSSTAQFGTTNSQPVEIIANNVSAIRIEPHPTSPSVIAGSASNNFLTPGSFAGTVGGGGAPGTNFIGYTCDLLQDCANVVTDTAGTVGGGIGNQAGNNGGTTVDAAFTTVGGGMNNAATNWSASVGGGRNNTAAGLASTVSGGSFNQSLGESATVGGGGQNQATGVNGTIAGGWTNIASGTGSTVAGGGFNRAIGESSFVAGGSGNQAPGSHAFAGGRFARANHSGCFVFADMSTATLTSCFAPNEIVVRGLGGFYFWTAGNADTNYSGATLAPGTGAWASLSDVHGKHSIDPVDSRDVLEKVVSMTIATWQWKNEPGVVRHMGPMAQDFHKTFRLGNSDTQIVTVDADGVALAAIQGLNAKLEAMRADREIEITALRAELADLRSLKEEVASLRAARAPESLAQR